MNKPLAAAACLFCLAIAWPLGAADLPAASSITSLDGQWLLAVDPQNVGRASRSGSREPVAAAKPTKVPWIIQDAFPGYHGVAWYWRDFTRPPTRMPSGPISAAVLGGGLQGRRLAQRRGRVGEHEGGESPFVLDVTQAIKPGRDEPAGRPRAQSRRTSRSTASS